MVKKNQIETITELIDGESVFESHGYAKIKVTREDTAKKIRLPIKSSGVAEFQEKLAAKAPKPPTTFEMIQKGSDEGKAMGLKHHQKSIVFDLTDESYIDAMEEHNNDFTWRVAVFALDLSWKKKDGKKADSYEEKKAILQSAGLTMYQMADIMKAVNKLTMFAGEQEDFLSET